jgi:outer membrane PBP1 activator LpoA protein
MNIPIRSGLLAGLLVVGACTTQAPAPEVDTAALEQRAAAAVAAGDYASAADYFRELAAAVTGSRRSAYLLEAAKLTIELKDYNAALAMLESARPGANDEQRQMTVVLTARIALEQNAPAMALEQLAGIGDPVTTEVLLAAADVRGQALFAVGRPVEAVASLAEREVWIDDAALLLANQHAIWDGLRASTAPLPLPQTGDAIVDGWLALAPIARSPQSDESLRSALLEWRVSHREHPAARGLLTELLALQRSAQEFPSRIALLLPLGSAAREEALAIRDGFMAAHLAASTGRATEIRVYDTSVEGGGAAYVRAQLDGADFIIGPLLREEVDAVVEHTGFVPTLALNYTQSETENPIDFYQFALAPEDEARAVAERAIASGARRAVAMVQANAYGERVFASFREQFEALGGEVIASMPYEPALQDYSGRIMSLMNIDRSYQRQRRLAANLGMEVSFEPRRRQDVDIIFISADPDAGRLLAPQLEYYYAGDIPSYATSEIYDPGRAGGDSDLNGVIFPDVPWLVAPDEAARNLAVQLRRYWPRRSADVPRFFGMGIDAYRFVPMIFHGQLISSVQGASGTLTSDAQGRIRRELPFAQFRNGRPEPLPPLPARATPEDLGNVAAR